MSVTKTKAIAIVFFSNPTRKKIKFKRRISLPNTGYNTYTALTNEISRNINITIVLLLSERKVSENSIVN